MFLLLHWPVCLLAILVDAENILLIEFEGRTVRYGPSFFATGKKRGSLTYSTDIENEVSKIFIISLEVNRARGKRNLQS